MISIFILSVFVIYCQPNDVNSFSPLSKHASSFRPRRYADATTLNKVKSSVLITGLLSIFPFLPFFGDSGTTIIPMANADATEIRTRQQIPRVEDSMSRSPSSVSVASASPDVSNDMLPPFTRETSVAQRGMARVASVMDLAGVLTPEEGQQLAQRIQTAQRRTGTEIEIVIVDQVQAGYTPKRMATTLFNQWRLGSERKNNGVLFLVVLDERRTEMEVGKALDQAMNSNWCTKFLKQTASPAFRKGQYGSGLMAALQKVSQKLLQVDRAATPRSRGSGLLHVDGQALLNWMVFGLFGLGILSFEYDARYPIKDNCPSCGASKDTWELGSWKTTIEATDQRSGLQELIGICANCGYEYTATKNIRRYDGSTTASDGNVSYYYDSDSSDSGGSSDGGGGGDSW